MQPKNKIILLLLIELIYPFCGLIDAEDITYIFLNSNLVKITETMFALWSL